MPLFWHVKNLKNFFYIPIGMAHIFTEANLERRLKNGKNDIIKIVHFLVESIRRHFSTFV